MHPRFAVWISDSEWLSYSKCLLYTRSYSEYVSLRFLLLIVCKHFSVVWLEWFLNFFFLQYFFCLIMLCFVDIFHSFIVSIHWCSYMVTYKGLMDLVGVMVVFLLCWKRIEWHSNYWILFLIEIHNSRFVLFPSTF